MYIDQFISMLAHGFVLEINLAIVKKPLVGNDIPYPWILYKGFLVENGKTLRTIYKSVCTV